jgi:hypothetical protein
MCRFLLSQIICLMHTGSSQPRSRCSAAAVPILQCHFAQQCWELIHLGLVRLHQSNSGLVWIGIKSMAQSIPQNNPSLRKKIYSVKPIMNYNPRVWEIFKLWNAWILSIAH